MTTTTAINAMMKTTLF